ncbi:alpha/beta hydrolase family protein [Myxococcus fulvus]|uniref:alpha/beta hydrolase family protein n=1 Tax=Myxococcus fulvus TaxID=33 RepID=UPI003B9D73B9
MKKSELSFRLGLLLALAWSSTAGAQALSSFSATYRGGGTSLCSSTYNLRGQEPAASGKYPVFIYTVGTTENYDHSSALAAVEEMASRGYVAATVEYDNATFGSCSTLTARSRCIFDGSRSTSAVGTLCSRAKADCSKGIVVAGFSQGSVMAILAKNHDSRVQAAYGLGAGVQYSIYNLSSCVANGNRTLPSNRLRIINGEQDVFVGPTESQVRAQNTDTTGYSCPLATSCLQSNGSGWYIIKDSQVGDLNADHCYMRSGSCVGLLLDTTWRSGSQPWSLRPNLNWLTQFTTP